MKIKITLSRNYLLNQDLQSTVTSYKRLKTEIGTRLNGKIIICINSLNKGVYWHTEILKDKSNMSPEETKRRYLSIFSYPYCCFQLI